MQTINTGLVGGSTVFIFHYNLSNNKMFVTLDTLKDAFKVDEIAYGIEAIEKLEFKENSPTLINKVNLSQILKMFKNVETDSAKETLNTIQEYLQTLNK